MIGTLTNLLKNNSKKLLFILIALLILLVTISVYTLLTPLTTSNEINANTSQIGTSYDYKATITSNILYPSGGTVEAGDTIFKKITTAIPFDLKSTINSDNEVIAKGTYEVQLVVNAGDLWERIFPLEKKMTFEQTGSEISVIDSAYKIDLEKINTFILRVEEETGIRPSQYTVEIIPNIEGTIDYDGQEKNIDVLDKLIFQYSNEEIKLSSEKTFTSITPFISIETITNKFLGLPLAPVRVASTSLSLLVLIIIIYTYKNFARNRMRPTKSQSDKINKKYGSRIILVSQKVNNTQNSIISLHSFKSIIKIADEKELPIFCHKTHENGSAIYFIVDGAYIYDYETVKTALVRSTEKGSGSEKAYANG